MARRAMKDLKGMGVAGNGEPVGQVRDVYFDDRTWTVRYLVLGTAQMMPGHHVLLPPDLIVPGTMEERSLRMPLTREQAESRPAPDDAMTLHAASELVGFAIQASDGSAGQVEDLLIDESNWSITAIVVDTRKWLPGKDVRLPRDAVRGIDWGDRRVDVALTREQLENAPQAA